MTIRVSGRERRVLLMGVVTIAALVLVFRGIPAWRTWASGARGAADELVAERWRAAQLVAVLPDLVDTLTARAEQFAALAPRFLEGRTAATSEAALAAVVTVAAHRADAQIGPLRMSHDTVPGGAFRVIGLEGTLNGDIHGVSRFLAALEGGDPAVRLTRVVVDQQDPNVPDDRPEHLTVVFRVEGLALRGDGR